MQKGVHEGHRERMREKIRKGGIGAFQQHEVLEYLLYSFVPRKDTNEIAHALIDRFSSLSGVLNASEDDLAKVNGMTQNAALFLATLPDVFRAYVDGVNSDGVARQDLSGIGRARNFMCSRLFGLNQEHLCVAALDAHDKLIKCEIIEQGSGDAVRMDVRKLVDFALRTGASAMLIAHNHPSGNILPSQKDVTMTQEAMSTLSGIGVELQDHLIFAGSEYYSFEENGTMEKIKSIQEGLREGIAFYE